MSFRSLRSAPAQNARSPAPVTTMQRVSPASRFSDSKSVMISVPSWLFIALAEAGRFRVTSMTCARSWSIFNVAKFVSMAHRVLRSEKESKTNLAKLNPSNEPLRLWRGIRAASAMSRSHLGFGPFYLIPNDIRVRTAPGEMGLWVSLHGSNPKSLVSALGHVWTAPWQELSDVAAALVGCGHVSGLLMRQVWPLALMLCADRVPIVCPHSKVR